MHKHTKAIRESYILLSKKNNKKGEYILFVS